MLRSPRDAARVRAVAIPGAAAASGPRSIRSPRRSRRDQQRLRADAQAAGLHAGRRRQLHRRGRPPRAVLAEMLRVAPGGRHLAFEPIPHLGELAPAGRSRPSRSVRPHSPTMPGVSEFAHVRGPAEGWSGLRFRPLPTGEEADVENIEVRLEVLDEVARSRLPAGGDQDRRRGGRAAGAPRRRRDARPRTGRSSSSSTAAARPRPTRPRPPTSTRCWATSSATASSTSTATVPTPSRSSSGRSTSASASTSSRTPDSWVGLLPPLVRASDGRSRSVRSATHQPTGCLERLS